MEQLLRIKYSKEPYRTKLLHTETLHIQEGNTWGDTFWGVCLETGQGENNLGKLIMKVRKEIKYG